MFHVWDGRRVALGAVPEANDGGGESGTGSRRPRVDSLLLPSDAPFERRTDRRHSSLRLGFYSFLSCSALRVRGVAWYPTSLGCWRLAFKSPRTHHRRR